MTVPKYRKGTSPVPVPNPISQPFWDATREHRLLIQRCANGHTFYYPRSHCPECLSNELSWVEASGKGTLYSFTVARRATSPDFEPDVPYVIAAVELAEGPRMTSMLVEANVDAVAIGTPVELVWDDEVSEELSIPCFRPVNGRG
ncbi:MAG: Zn-ribbon domain-containing OB-fold protein [Dehalococcoidia bacterium]